MPKAADTGARDQKPRGASFFSWRGWLMALLIIGLTASNIASVLSAGFHQALFDMVSSPLRLIAPMRAAKLLERSPTRVAQRATDKLKAQVARSGRALAASKANARRVRANLAKALVREQGLSRALDVSKVKLATTAKRLETAQAAVTRHRQAFKGVRERTLTRMLKAKAVNMVSLPARTVPFAGVALTLGVAAYEIKTDCDMLADLDGLGATMGERQPDDGGQVCGLSIPDGLTYVDAAQAARDAMATLAIDEWWASEVKKSVE